MTTEEPDEPDGDPTASVDWDELLAELADREPEAGWVTLDEAANAAGVARSTLRSWYRSGQLPSQMVVGTHGPQRLVPLEVVLERAARSVRVQRQLVHLRSLEAEIAELRQRLETIEQHLGLG